jgi:N6-adenosine-specific RNA methylase IME4/ParB-like chromosome segregation protein Spo0J
MPPTPSTLPISAIRVGRRHRKHLGDLQDLAASIAEVGLLHPIVVTPDRKLIAGERRLRAVRILDWTKVPVRVVDLDDIIRGEHAENTHRLDFLPSEIAAIAKAIRPLEEAAARERMLAGRPSGKLPQGRRRTSERIAKVAGIGRRTLEKIEAVVAAAKTNPRKYGKLADEMDRTGRVDGVYRELKQRQERTANYESRTTKGCCVDDLRALAKSGYQAKVIYVDAPSRHEVYNGEGKSRSAERRYNTLTVEEIKHLGPLVRSVAAKDCALFYWCSGATYADALEVVRAWGFECKTIALVWVKTTPRAKASLNGKGLHWGMGSYTRANVEVVLLATRGKPRRLANDVHQIVFAPVGNHSAKPEEVRRRIERLYAGPYLELFGRSNVTGWTVWGNEVEREEFLQAAE